MAGKKLIIILFILIVLLLPFSSIRFSTWLLGEARVKQNALPGGNISIPEARTLNWQSNSILADSLYRNWADEPYREWETEGKMHVPRKILGNLLAGKNVEEINDYIKRLQPRGTTGSKWLLHPSGDYDFTLTVLTTILYLFDSRPDVLYPDTRRHLTEVLLTVEGDGFTLAVPRTLGRIKDSENHLLMSEGSRYLKNRYRMLHGNTGPVYNNEQNGMEEKILGLLNEINSIGLYEFNSVPYLGYTIGAILNLETFGSPAVREAARDVLDYLNYGYALGSYRFRYYPPFRRLLSRSENTSLSRDYHTSYMKAWLSYLPEYQDVEIEYGKHHALIGACMPYRPPDEVVRLIGSKGDGYFVKLGHGKKSSPEIYSAGPGYLISAGGVNRGKWSIIVARPTCLFIDDDAGDITEVLHIRGKSDDFMEWNNTGVHEDFACGKGPVYIPGGFIKVAENHIWEIYRIYDSLMVAVHSSADFGMFTVIGTRDPVSLASGLLELNPDMKKLKTMFRYPNGQVIVYDVMATSNKWVIKSLDDDAVDRNFDAWPLMSGEIFTEGKKRMELQKPDPEK